MSDYDFRPGGSLKLKGVAEGGVMKKWGVKYLSELSMLILSFQEEEILEIKGQRDGR